MADRSGKAIILEEYDKQFPLHNALAMTAKELLSKILGNMPVKIQPISARCKTRASLSHKLDQPEKGYAALAHITDIAAVRIITYFAEDISRIASAIEREFTVDRENTVDKRNALDPEKFGYQSLHYVVAFSEERSKLLEYAKFAGLKFEIQVRSILQHAWAEIEHDLGYKSAISVPREVRRRFSRVAGLLELADEEFSGIRRELSVYADSMLKRIEVKPDCVEINKVSLKALVTSSTSAARHLSQEVAALFGCELSGCDDARVERCVHGLHIAEIGSIAEAEAAARSNRDAVIKYALSYRQEGSIMISATAEIGVNFMLLVVLSNNAGKLYEYMVHLGANDPHFWVKHQMDRVAHALKS